MEIRIGSGIVATVHADGSATLRFHDALTVNHIASAMALMHLQRAADVRKDFPESANYNRALHDDWNSLRRAVLPHVGAASPRPEGA